MSSKVMELKESYQNLDNGRPYKKPTPGSPGRTGAKLSLLSAFPHIAYFPATKLSISQSMFVDSIKYLYKLIQIEV
jgi:hypothetical protein